MEYHRSNLAERYDFNVSQIYELIQPAGSGQPIDFDQLRGFIRKNGENITEDDILCVLKRYDKDQDAKLSYQEFASAILPSYANAVSPQQRSERPDNKSQRMRMSELRSSSQF